MAGLTYIALVFAAAVLAGLLGAVAHYWRAHAAVFPEDLGLGEPLNTLTRDDYQFEKHVAGAEWDDNGYWDGGSVRNLVYYVVSSAGSVLALGLMFWSSRAEIVAHSCAALTGLGLSPPVCF